MSHNEYRVPRPAETAETAGTAGTAGAGPLAGLRVLELAQNLAGPYCSQILAQLGADVIKVERPGGDAARGWGPPFVGDDGSIFAAANRGKRSIVLDLNTDRDADVLRALIAHTDILIEAFRPGSFTAMGFDYETVRGWNDRLIYCSVLAYGETGPLRSLPGYDPLMQAHGGLISITGEPGSRGARVGTSVIDMGTGMWLVIAIMAALRERDVSGTGTRLSVSLYETALAWNAYHIAGYLDTGFVPQPMGTELPMIAPYGAVPASDGEVMVAAGNDGLFRRLCDALDLPHVRDDERFGTNATRVAHRSAVNDALHRATAALSTRDLMARLQAHGVPCAPIQDIAEVSGDPQTIASGMIEHGDGATAVKLPLRFASERPGAGSRPPRIGEHTVAILEELGKQ